MTRKTKLLAALSLLILALVACSPQTTPPVPRPSELSASYHYTAEVKYEHIEIAQGILTYTRLGDLGDRCAQWLAQAPCWTEEDFVTSQVELPDSDIDSLIDLVRQSGFMALDDTYGGAESTRYYAYTLTVKLGETEQTVVYESFPDADPMPDAQRQVIDRLYELIGQDIEGADGN